MSTSCILMVDDDPNILKFVSANLKIRGFEVITADDGESALEIMNQTSPNLVILDILMPGIDGAEVCRRIRQTSEVPIIMLTAIGEPSHREELMQLGASDYVTKPFDVADLLERVRALLSQ